MTLTRLPRDLRHRFFWTIASADRECNPDILLTGGLARPMLADSGLPISLLQVHSTRANQHFSHHAGKVRVGELQGCPRIHRHRWSAFVPLSHRSKLCLKAVSAG